VGEPYTVLQVGAYRVGVIGLTRYPESEPESYVFLDPWEVLAALVPEVSEQADTVILLTNLTYRATMELVATVPGVDLAIAALPMQLPSAAVPMPRTGTLVVTAEQPITNHSGRRVGRLALLVDSDGSLTAEAWESRAMGDEFGDDPFMKALLDEFRE
jgi:2',3'-cyclic-nucleotide 2'-phosphodiesterase (5'-nucleotidase family)